MTLSELALQKAQAQIGQHEDPLGSNWGFPVKGWLG